MEIDEWFSVQPLMHYLYLNEIDVPMSELRRFIMSSHPVGENVSFLLLQNFSSGGIWRGGGPAMPVSGMGASAGASSSGQAPPPQRPEALGTSSSAGAKTSAPGTPSTDLEYSFIDVMEPMHPGMLPVVPVEARVHGLVRAYVAIKMKPASPTCLGPDPHHDGML